MTAIQRIIIDTDPGVGIPGTDADDPIAILFAVSDPRLELVGVTTVFGNTPPELGARGARLVLDTAGRPDVPVSVGSAVRLSGDLPAQLVEAYAGVRGREGAVALPRVETAVTGKSAADFIVEQVNAHPGEITLVTIGPMTNIALALEIDPMVCKKIHSIVFMGGALGRNPRYGRGNITAVAECNIWYDAPAAARVLASGANITMVGLDATNPDTGLVLRDDQIRDLDTKAGRVERLLASICATYLTAPMFDLVHGCVLYDPLAVVAAADPDVGSFEDLRIAVETRGEFTEGQTVEVTGPPNVHAMVDVDGRSVVDAILRSILRLDTEAA